MIGVVERRRELAMIRDLGELYEQHALEAVRVAYLLTGDAALAEDLVQDAFVRLIGRLAHLRHVDAFPAYLRSTVVNLSRMHFRRRKVERASLPALVSGLGHIEERDVASIEAVRSALLSLPHKQRAAIVLRYYCDLPDAESAIALGCSQATVRSLVARGRNRLGELMSEV